MGHAQHTPTRQPAHRRIHDGVAEHVPDESRAGVRYAGPCFAAASALPLAAGLGRPGRLLTLMAAGVRRPRRIVALIVLLLRTRTEAVPLSQSPAGRELSIYFGQRFLGLVPQNRLCRAVLILPRKHADYMRGRHRQALRTNLRRAGAAGIRCEWVTGPSRASDACREIFRRRRLALMTDAEVDCTIRSWSKLFGRSDITLGVARDPRGAPLALVAAAIDERICLIHAAVASNHEARWALHDHLVRFLIARGVKYLLCEGGGPFGALGFPPEIHHYQRLLGYEIRHVVPMNAQPYAATSRHRLFDALVRYPANRLDVTDFDGQIVTVQPGRPDHSDADGRSARPDGIEW